MLAVLDNFVENGDLQLLEPFEAFPDDAVDFSKASPEDAVELVFDAVFRPEFILCYLPCNSLAISAQWLPRELWSYSS
jgi:hypothetical protein